MPALTRIELPSNGPEDVLVSETGRVYTGTSDGWIYAVDAENATAARLQNTGGVPLGLERLSETEILVCDAIKGVLTLDIKYQKIEFLATQVSGRQLRFCNNAAVARDGTVYFSESSTRHSFKHSTRDIIEHVPTGSLYRRRPDGDIDELLHGLYFANGVCLSPDESFVLVAESGESRITKLHLIGRDVGKRERFATLKGLPDNLSIGSDGLLWVALVAHASNELTKLQQAPFVLRRFVARIPQRLLPSPPPMLRVAAYDFAGTCVHDFVGDANCFHTVTGIREHCGRVYLGTLADSAIAYFDVPT